MRRSGVRLFVAAIGFCAVAAPSSAAELLTNGSFEEVKDGKPVGWRLPRHYRFEGRGGMNGTHGLAFEKAGDDGFHSYPSQAVPFEPGKRYEFSAWVRTDGLSKDVGLCVEWFNAAGKWISGSYTGQGTKGTHDWMKLSSATPPIPSEAKSVRINFLVKKGGIGKAWFDDISVRPLERPMFGGLYSSAYRNLAVDGKVRFHAAVNLKGHDGVTAVFSYRDAGGAMRSAKATRMTADAAVFEIEAASLAEGTHPVSCDLVDASGRKVGGGSLAFTRACEPPKRRVWIDAKRRTIVDGRPFFPLGIYLSEITDRGGQFGNFLTGPFNCAMPYVAPGREQLDRCRAAGIEVIYPIHTAWSWSSSKNKPKGIVTDADADRYVERTVNEFKDHPALLAWYCNDERPLSRIRHLTARQRLLERIDPGHPTWTVLYQYGEVRGYYDSFDVIGTDPYPVPQASIGNVTLWTRTTDEEVMGLKPMWQVPQAFDWHWHRRNFRRGMAEHRFPTREEFMSMSWQPIAVGVKGLIWYDFNWFVKDIPKEEYETTLAYFRQTVSDIARYSDVFLSVEPVEQPTTSAKGVTTRSWRVGEKRYLLAVNTQTSPVQAEVSPGGAEVKAVHAEIGNAPSVTAGKLVFDLPALGFSFVSF